MKKFLFVISLFLTLVSYAQIINIPDANFKNALVNTNCVDTNNDGALDSDVDTDNDGEIQISEAEVVLNLYLDFQNIVSLEGLSYFVNLVELSCSDNPLIELNTSALINLEEIRCVDIDQVLSLDFSSNIYLRILECDVNDSLEFLNIQNGNNQNLVKMWAQSSPNLQCIQVDDVNYANNQICETYSGWCKDDSTEYSMDCPGLEISENDLIYIELFPNPFEAHIGFRETVKLEKFEIFSLYGQIILQDQVDGNRIDLSKLSSGIYFIRLINKNGTILRKIIKQ